MFNTEDERISDSAVVKLENLSTCLLYTPGLVTDLSACQGLVRNGVHMPRTINQNNVNGTSRPIDTGKKSSKRKLRIEQRERLTDPRPLTTAPEKHLWFLPHVIAPSTLPTTSLPSGVGYGVAYTTFCLDPTVYLRNLQRTILSFLKARILRHTLCTNNGLAYAINAAQGDQSLRLGNVDVWINATGLGSKALVHDDGMFPTRGQTILVKGEARKAITWIRENGGVSYVIPRPGGGGTILGGCKQDGNWDETVDEDLAKQILTSCKELAPELVDEKNGEFEVLGHQVGFRPSRRGGLRVEGEELDGGGKVVHCYGHAGGG
ncbi:MAG: hypothetical protein M1836_001055 [Candelina mexicana]|nr:MAG: hypothetical protein M1836_001055 [Candelina mexicana]